MNGDTGLSTKLPKPNCKSLVTFEIVSASLRPKAGIARLYFSNSCELDESIR